MLHNESNAVKKLNIQFGAANQIFYEDTQQLLKFKFQDYISNFLSLSQLVSQNQKQFFNQISSITTQFSQIMVTNL